MTRIKYSKGEFLPLLCTNSIICNGKIVTVNINTKYLIYRIISNHEVLVEGQGTSLSDCKRKVKRDLINLGANFNQEIRNRGKTRKL